MLWILDEILLTSWPETWPEAFSPYDLVDYHPLPFILMKNTEMEMLNPTFEILVSIEPKAALLCVNRYAFPPYTTHILKKNILRVTLEIMGKIRNLENCLTGGNETPQICPFYINTKKISINYAPIRTIETFDSDRADSGLSFSFKN